MNKLKISEFNLTGQPNEYCGLVFRIQQQGNRYIFDFLVQELNDKGIPPLTIRMSPDRNHKRPHIHLDRGRQSHVASIALDNLTILNGKLSNKEYSLVRQWIVDHRSTLLELWKSANESADYILALTNVKETWEYNGAIFAGNKPLKQFIIAGVIFWHNGDLISIPTQDEKIIIKSSGEVCAYFTQETESQSNLFIYDCPKYQCKCNSRGK